MGTSARPARRDPKRDPYRTLEIVRSPAVLDILKKLIGPGLRLHGSKLNMKSAHYGSPVEWHQDWAFYPHTNDDVLAIGVLLDDCDLSKSGCHRGV